jgi:hypothetical protein
MYALVAGNDRSHEHEIWLLPTTNQDVQTTARVDKCTSSQPYKLALERLPLQWRQGAAGQPRSDCNCRSHWTDITLQAVGNVGVLRYMVESGGG